MVGTWARRVKLMLRLARKPVIDIFRATWPKSDWFDTGLIGGEFKHSNMMKFTPKFWQNKEFPTTGGLQFPTWDSRFPNHTVVLLQTLCFRNNKTRSSTDALNPVTYNHQTSKIGPVFQEQNFIGPANFLWNHHTPCIHLISRAGNSPHQRHIWCDTI